MQKTTLLIAASFIIAMLTGCGGSPGKPTPTTPQLTVTRSTTDRTSIALSWFFPTDTTAISYGIYRQLETEGTMSQLKTVDVQQTTLTDTVTNSYKYMNVGYQVASFDKDGTITAITEVAVAEGGMPGPP